MPITLLHNPVAARQAGGYDFGALRHKTYADVFAREVASLNETWETFEAGTGFRFVGYFQDEAGNAYDDLIWYPTYTFRRDGIRYFGSETFQLAVEPLLESLEDFFNEELARFEAEA